MNIGMVLGERVSLGQGQPIFYTKDITSVNKRGNQVVGYSHTQKKDIILFTGDNESDLDDAMKKMGELLDVKYV
jgi:hypothetical protein